MEVMGGFGNFYKNGITERKHIKSGKKEK